MTSFGGNIDFKQTDILEPNSVVSLVILVMPINTRLRPPQAVQRGPGIRIRAMKYILAGFLDRYCTQVTNDKYQNYGLRV